VFALWRFEIRKGDMDFRSKTAISTERVGLHLQAMLPLRLLPRLTQDLVRALKTLRHKQEFSVFADSLQNQVNDELMNTYADSAFCKLLSLKVSNLAMAKYHFIHRHSELLSRPLQLTVDPTNACQLACPGCVHSENKNYSRQFDWPRNTLNLQTYDDFLQRVGPFAFCLVLYNYGEPLLHKQFNEFVHLAKKYLLFTMASTNLSMPILDPTGLVASGLDRLVLSIDGTTQDVYGKYRRKGQLDLVYDNVRKIVAAKRRLRSDTPYLVWQFLTFAHNAHQVGEAHRDALILGVNELLVATPFSVALDNPEMRPVVVKQRGRHVFKPWDGNWCTPNRRAGASEVRNFDDLLSWSWAREFQDAASGSENQSSASRTCEWLYTNLTLDGAERLLPCCMAPDHQEKSLVFGRFADTAKRSLTNTEMGILARLAFADRQRYDVRARDSAIQPFCAQCTEKPEPYGLANIAGDMHALDPGGVLPRSLKWQLTNWR
jgi:pyruvate-formate lyase-activating enzyme